jgi:ElaB/YqjD/DUF883 family membrane-anchored ribosome-binding protein
MATNASTTEQGTASRTAGAGSEALSQQIDVIRKDIGTLTELVAEIGAQRKDAASQQVQDRVTELRARAEAAGDEARHRAGEMEARAEKQMRDHPGSTLLVATGLGFLAGLLMSRK